MPNDHTQQTSEGPARGVNYMAPRGAQSEGGNPAGKPGASPEASPAQNSTGPTSAQQPGPEAQAAQMQAQLQQSQQQLNRMRSQLSASDRALRDRESQWAQEREEIAATVEQMQMSDMSDSERVVYERDVYRQRAEQAQEQASEMSYRLEYTDAMQQWRSYYQQMGVPVAELDNSSIENMQHSALRYTNARMRAMQTRVQQANVSPGRNTPPVSTGRIQPPVVTNAVPQGSNPGQRRWSDIPYEEWDSMYKKAERGQISPDQLPK